MMRMTMVSERFALVALVATLMGSTPALADGRFEAKDRKAHVECAAGNYAEGVRLLAELWVATKDTAHLYNQGRCYEMNGQNDLAVSRFREYLRKATKLRSGEFEAVNRHIDELQGQASNRAAPTPTVITLVQQPAAVPVQPPVGPPVQSPVPAPPALAVDRSASLVSSPQPSPVSDSPIYARWWFWTGVGAVVAGGVVTAVLLSSHFGQKSPACDQGVPCVR
jgi:hypothetical protein